MAKARNIKQESKQELQQVHCDMCLDKQVPALKTCLKCEISMCAQHLQAHLTTPVLLQTHPLIKPTVPGGLSSGTVRCPDHGKLLEYYCLDDRICVCVSCSIEDQHRLHNMKTLPCAHKVLVEKLREELMPLAKRETQGKALSSWETAQTKALEKSSGQLVNGVSVLCKTGLTKVQNSVAARLGEIQTAQQNIQAALSEEDAYLFLQRYAGVHEALEKTRVVDFIHGLEKSAEPDKVVSDLLKYGCDTMKKVKQLQRDLLFLVDPNKCHWVETKPTNVAFDPKSLREPFLASSDFKTLFCQSPIQYQVSQTVYLQNDMNGDLTWAIHFSDKYDWRVGICDWCDKRACSQQEVLYGLESKNKQIIGLNTEQLNRKVTKVLHLTENVTQYPSKFSATTQVTDYRHKLQVHWDCTSQTLSFFTRANSNEMICLHSVNAVNYSTGKLRPFVTLVKRPDDFYSRQYGNTQSQNYYTCNYVDFVCSVEDNFLAVYSRG